MWFLSAYVYQLSVGALASKNSSQLKWEGVLIQLNECSGLTLGEWGM